MTGAMYAAIGGLKTHMSNLNVIGNNIANVNTVGYKAQRMTFQESIYTTSKSGSDGGVTTGGNNPSQIGYGASVGSIDLNMNPGTYSPTGFGLDCMMMGEGFFAVGTKDIVVNGASDLSSFTLTRVGDFWKDAKGYITDRGGEVAYGFQTVQNPFKNTEGLPYASWLGYTGEQLLTVQGATSDTILSAQIGPMRFPVAATAPTKANGGLLDDGTTLWNTGDPVYDLMGPVMKDEDGNLYRGTVSIADIVSKAIASTDITPGVPPTAEGADRIEIGTGDDAVEYWTYVDPENPVSRVTMDKNSNVIAIEFCNGTGRADGGLIIDKDAGTSVMGSNESKHFPDIDTTGPDFAVKYDETADADLTTYPGYYRYTGPIPDKDGLLIEPSSMTVTAQGGISCQDSNGNTVVAGYLLVLSCASNDGVTHIGECYYKAMEGAGDVRGAALGGILQGRYISNKLLIDEMGDDKIPSGKDAILSGGTNEIKNAGLEASTTDIATEFSNMIITQRGYQANTRIVTVTDSMLEELVNMKR